MDANSLEKISVVVPDNPFAPANLPEGFHHCLCALDVEKLMNWWPGNPHNPERDASKVKAIQRSLDWKRVAKIAAYLLQDEIEDCGNLLQKYFGEIYEPSKNDPGREWPPRIRGTVTYTRSSFPFFSNVLVHINGAKFDENTETKTANIVFDPNAKHFQLSVIDGQHRINGAYFALKIRQETHPTANYEVPAEVFIDLDPAGDKPQRQAQIFIDVNLYQKKVDRSLVVDLFPTTRENDPLDYKDRAQDIGRRLMIEEGPLVGMIQIPGIKYGVKDVVTLATLVDAIENIIPVLNASDIDNLESQTVFISQFLDSWLQGSGRAAASGAQELDSQNVVYQGRILVSIIDLVPLALVHLRDGRVPLVSENAKAELIALLKNIIENAGLSVRGQFLPKEEFRKLGFLGSGGIAKFRNLLWIASKAKKKVTDKEIENHSELASSIKSEILSRAFK